MWLYQSFQNCFHTNNQKPYIQCEYANSGKYDKKLYSKKDKPFAVKFKQDLTFLTAKLSKGKLLV